MCVAVFFCTFAFRCKDTRFLLPSIFQQVLEPLVAWMSLVGGVGRGQDHRSGYVIDFGEGVSLGLVASLANWRRNLRSTVLVLVRLALEMDPEGRLFQRF